MSFDSLAFTVFFIFILSGYYLLSGKPKTIFLLVGSYIFYASINLAFLPLILASTATDYYCGLQIKKRPNQKKVFLYLSLIVNIGILFFFKYYIFAAENVNILFDYFDLGYSLPLIKVFFPVGISFYTIQTIGYTVDVYKGDIEPEKDFFVFALFVCFFPQLVAGPLERAKKLIPQFPQPFKLTYSETQKYLFYIFLGLVKKTVVSDRLFGLIQHNLEDPARFEHASKNFFTFYIAYYRLYYDFSAYSMMGIGIAGLLGIHLSKNFHHPMYATNISDFWRQWHITLHDWLRDYIYKPLRERSVNKVAAIFAVFVISGLWHGADWNFLLWGCMNATYLVAYEALVGPFLKNKTWAKGKSFKVLSSIFNNQVLAITTPFYFLTDIKDSLDFMSNAFLFSQFRMNAYWEGLPYNLRVDLLTAIPIMLLLEGISLRIYLKKQSVESYYQRPKLLNAVIISLFLLTFFLSKERGPLFRYYFF